MLQFFFTFSGRINRSKFWIYWALYFVTGLIFDRVLSLLDAQPGSGQPAGSGPAEVVLLIVGLAYVIVVTWSYFAVHIKRWHDRDKSGWWVLIGFVPIVGFIWTMVECGFLKGTDGDNRFGPDPLGPDLVSAFD